MPGLYRCTLNKPGPGRPEQHNRLRGPEAAAAKAMELAIFSKRYIIFAPNKVLEHIPPFLRNSN